MSSRGQPTPPFNSPYQQAMKPASLLQTPAYPSPARSDSEPLKYPAEGLGLYAYSQSFPASGPPTSSGLYPPSPQPTEGWTHLSAGTSPLMTDASTDPWAPSYDHPASRSPLPWASHHASHRSSLSSTRDMSIFSREGSEHPFPHVKLESGPEWVANDETSPPSLRHPAPLTVEPERLTTGIFPYEHAYSSSPMPRFDATVGESYESGDFESMSYEGRSRSPFSRDNSIGVTARTRHRRNPTTAENANYECHKCGKLFQRSYNHKTHLETHNPSRKKEYVCPHKDCDKQFVRKTDLDRHQKSVHLKLRNFHCSRCDAHFARKDTLRR